MTLEKHLPAAHLITLLEMTSSPKVSNSIRQLKIIIQTPPPHPPQSWSFPIVALSDRTSLPRHPQVYHRIVSLKALTPTDGTALQ